MSSTSSKNVLFVLFSFSVFTLSGQMQLEHERKIYENDEGNVYVNKAEPVYLSISTRPDGSDAKVLKGQDPVYSYPMYLDTEGYNSIRSPWKVDPETKETIYPKQEVIFEIYADGTAPVITTELVADNKYQIEGVSYFNGRELSLAAKDALAGVASIYYSVDNASFSKYSNPISFDGEQKYTVSYYAVDQVGNVGKIEKVIIFPDLKAPETALEITGDQYENTVSSRASIALASTDEASGVAKTFYQIDEGSTYVYSSPIRLSALSEGEHTITYFASDNVDNIEEKNQYTFYVDKSAPSVISEIIGKTFFANGREYYSGRTKLKLVAMDNKSGVKEISYSINGADFKPYTAPFYLAQAGTLTLQVRTVDNVNNEISQEEFSDKNKLRAFVDLSGPELDFSVNGPSFMLKDTLLITNETLISFSGKDSESGFKEIDYQLNDGILQKYAAPFTIEKEDFYEVTFNGYDNLQNSNTTTTMMRVDNTGPEIFNRFSINSNKVKVVDGERLPVYPSHTILFLSATDRYAGLNKINYTINDSQLLAYRGAIENFKEGKVYEITAEVQDKLGNTSSQEIRFYVE